MPFCKLSLKAQKPLPDTYPQILRTIGDHLKKKRLDLGLLQKEVGERLGVDETTICNWENNRTAPVFRFMPKIIEFLGYVPYGIKAKTLGEKILAYRKLLGLSQEMLARKLGVDPGTLARWEQGKNKPKGKHLEILDEFLSSSFLARPGEKG